MATIPQVISNLYVSSYKCALYNAKQQLFSPALAAPKSPVTILMVADGLSWGYSGGASTAQLLSQVANYGIWISGKFYLEATTVTGEGGGSVSPIPPGGGGTGFSYPLRLTGSDFEVDGVTYNNPNIVGANLMLFVSGFNEEWQFAPTFFQYTSTGIVIVFPDFNANNYDQIIIQQYFNP